MSTQIYVYSADIQLYRISQHSAAILQGHLGCNILFDTMIFFKNRFTNCAFEAEVCTVILHVIAALCSSQRQLVTTLSQYVMPVYQHLP